MIPRVVLWAGLLAVLIRDTVADEDIDDIFGLRKDPYAPRCAHACREALAVSPLPCTSNNKNKTSFTCWANDGNYLNTLAYCIHSHCNETASTLDTFWYTYAVGWKIKTPAPKYSYETALLSAGNPGKTLEIGSELNDVYRVSDVAFVKADRSLYNWVEAERYHSSYALAMFIAGIAIPVALSLARFIPMPSAFKSHYRALLVYPTLWSHQWSVQRKEAGDLSPTRGHAFFILYLIMINVIFVGAGHFSSAYIFSSFDGRHGQLITSVANRFGALSLANLPLLFLYAGRNNLLLKVTDWSHMTMIMLHRWLAYIVTAEAGLHSILYLHVAVQEHAHTAWSHAGAWIFGSIATIAICLMAPLSIIHMRKRAYELFLMIHIGLAILVIIGTFFHISKLFASKQYGWILYLCITILIWAFDRASRIVRILLNGVRRATVTIIDEEYLRVDIPRAKGTGHAYLYFPTLSLRFWENHPFSIALSGVQDLKVYEMPSTQGSSNKALSSNPSLMEHEKRLRYPGTDSDNGGSLHYYSESNPYGDSKSPDSLTHPDSLTSPNSLKSPASSLSPWTPITPGAPWPSFEKTLSTSSLISPSSATKLARSGANTSTGLTFFMRTHGGTTSLLRRRTTLPVLVEASYGKPKDLSAFPVLICVAGGVGITAILPYLHVHRGTTRLYWGSRSAGLVDALREEVRGYNGEISVGKRIFVKLQLQQEFHRFDQKTPVAVVVSGPKSMCEEVREYCCEVAKTRSGELRFLDENFSW